jgi:hypothetical protein
MFIFTTMRSKPEKEEDFTKDCEYYPINIDSDGKNFNILSSMYMTISSEVEPYLICAQDMRRIALAYGKRNERKL